MADDLLLDDADALAVADRRGRLRSVASAGAHVRRAVGEDDAVRGAVMAGRPRAVLLVGDAAGVGSLVTSVARLGAPLPVVLADSDRVPGWVGSLDFVVVVGVTGHESAALAAAGEAARRGARVLVVAPDGSPLTAAPLPTAGGGVVPVHVDADSPDGAASLWSLAVPVLRVADGLGLVDAPAPALLAAADRLDAVAVGSGLGVPLVENPAKTLGLAVAESSPVVWGSGAAGVMAAARLTTRLAADAGVPAHGAPITDAAATVAGLLSGPLARSLDIDDVFRDRVEDPDGERRLRLVLLRDAVETALEVHLAGLVTAAADRHEVALSQVVAQAEHGLERVAELVALVDWAAAYAGLALGVDPRGVQDALGRVTAPDEPAAEWST